MSWAALLVCLLQPWCLSGIIMPNPTTSTNTPSLQNDITLLTQTVTSLQSTTGQLKTDLLAAKSDLVKNQQAIQSMQQQSAAEIASLKAEIQAMKAELQQSSDELNQVKSELESMKQNLSITQDVQSVKEQIFNLSNTLESKTRDVAFHVSQPHHEQTTYTPVTFSKILYNSGDGYNLTTGTFTAPVSGTYMFWTQVENGQPNTYTNIWIMKTGRGDILSSGWVLTDSSISEAVATSQTVLHLNMSEEVWVELTVEHILDDNDASFFGGALLSVQ
ncbi:uncharacterized protein [Haliotis asinina]|uniref:uncharacterized protein n=1 Tax=Haliotis asinina TaxID=109174 RepID=UPI003531A7B1